MSSGTQITRVAPNTSIEIPDPLDLSDFPLYQPIKKLEGNIQCTGEAKYVDDIQVCQFGVIIVHNRNKLFNNACLFTGI